MKKSSLPKPITLLVLTLITSIVWVGLSVYRAVTIQPPQTVPENISKSLNPVLNSSALDDVDSRIFFEDQDIPEIGTLQNNFSEPTSSPVDNMSLEIIEPEESSESAETPI